MIRSLTIALLVALLAGCGSSSSQAPATTPTTAPATTSAPATPSTRSDPVNIPTTGGPDAQALISAAKVYGRTDTDEALDNLTDAIANYVLDGGTPDQAEAISQAAIDSLP